MSVTLVSPAEAVGRNEIPFDKDTRADRNNMNVDMTCPAPPREGGFRIKLWSKFAVHIAANPVQIPAAEWLLGT